MPKFPVRYASTAPAETTFMQRAMEQASTASRRQELLSLVDWNTPDTRLDGFWSDGSSLRASMVTVHPLSTIARLGDEKLFSEALEQAHAASVSIYVGERRDAVAVEDWVASGVLDTVAACGTTGMLKSLIGTLLQRSDKTRRPEPSREYGEPDPWRAMAKHGDRTAPPAQYGKKLALLDRFHIAGQRKGLAFVDRQAPPTDGSGRLSAWEARSRQAIHTYALQQAAQYGHPTLVAALLDRGLAQVTPDAIRFALQAGAADLACQMMAHPNGLSALLALPAVSSSDNHSSWSQVSVPETVGLSQVLDVVSSLGECAHRYSQVSPGQVSEQALSTQRDAICRLVDPCLKLLSRFTPDQLLEHGMNSTSNPATTMLPALILLDDIAARDAYRSLLACRGHDKATLMPGLEQWSYLISRPLSAWMQIQAEGLRALSPSEVEQYRDDTLSASLYDTWNAMGDARGDSMWPVDFDEIEVVRYLWPQMDHPEGSGDIAAWLDEQSKRAGFPPERQASIQERLMDARSAPARAMRAAPRL